MGMEYVESVSRRSAFSVCLAENGEDNVLSVFN